MTENLFASGAAVVGATILTHPIDVVKVQLQMAEKSCAKADSFSATRFVSFWAKFQHRQGVSGLAKLLLRTASFGNSYPKTGMYVGN